MDKAHLEAEWGKAGTAVIEFDPELGQPIVAGPVPLPNELYKNEADARADIERILGIYALMQGDGGGAPQTYKGTVALDEYGQRRIKSKRDDIEECINQLAKVVVSLIQYVYTDEKVFRLMQPNNRPTEIQINHPLYDNVGNYMGKVNDITIGKYDVIVLSGSTLPSNRWARFEYYMQLYSSGLIDQIEVLKQTDVADMEGVLERAGQMQQMQAQVQAQTEEIKNLKGDLQTAHESPCMIENV
jgi:cell division protein FtsB